MKRQFVLAGLLAITCSAQAQLLSNLRTMPVENMTSSVTLPPPAFVPAPYIPVAPAKKCATFVEPFDVDDYSGPLSKVVGKFSQRIDSATVQLPRHHSPIPCAMDAHDKFNLFVNHSADPLNFLGAAWDAGTAHIAHTDAAYGQGAAGFGHRYSSSLTDSVAGEFFGTFLYPSLFHQDPRYYRMGQGPASQRLAHALAHRFVARSDSGHPMFNYSEWMTTISMKALSNVYHPGNPRGFGPTARRVGFSVSNDMAWDVLREFWPEIARKFKLPFRTHQPVAKAPVPVLAREPVRQASEENPTPSGRPVLEAARLERP